MATHLVKMILASHWQFLNIFMKVLHTFFSLFAASASAPAQMGGTESGKTDVLFECIEDQQGDIPFGDVLDAGTGTHSLTWIASLAERKGMTSLTAITADETMQKNVKKEAQKLGVLKDNNIIVGNWFGDLQLPQTQFDTIIADYLIGAMDGFSPYRQDEIIPKLMNHLKPGGRMYIVGLEPIPDSTTGLGNIICKTRQIRDACILLAGHRCYREYPVQWVERQITRAPNLRLVRTDRFPILYRYHTIARQINVGRSKFSFFPTEALVSSIKVVLDELDRQAFDATIHGPIQFGFDYVVSAEKITAVTQSECN